MLKDLWYTQIQVRCLDEDKRGPKTVNSIWFSSGFVVSELSLNVFNFKSGR